MNKEQYVELVNKVTPKENRLYNMVVSFISGGVLGVISTVIYEILVNTYSFNVEDAKTLLIIILIGIASLLTGLNKFDNIMQKFKCGLLIPITGFAHSMTSSSMEYKREGLISGVGANVFKLAGSVIVYGVFVSIILTIVKVIIL